MFSRAKDITGIKGRTWTVSRELMREMPAGVGIDADFEHDVDGGRAADMLILSTLGLLVIILVVWRPGGVYLPWWLWLPVIAVVLFFGVRWLLRLPWKLMAHTDGDYASETSAETWVGAVRGVNKAREEVNMITKQIRKYDRPNHANGVLKKQT